MLNAKDGRAGRSTAYLLIVRAQSSVLLQEAYGLKMQLFVRTPGNTTSRLIGFSTAAITTTLVEKPWALECGSNKDPYGRDEDIGTLCTQGRLKEALDTLHLIDKRGIHIDSDIYGSLLQGSAKMRALKEGKHVHADIIKTGFEQDMYVGNNLVNMYAKCGSMENAYQVFDKMPIRTVVSWNAMISGYARNGQGEEAFNLYCQMQEEPNQFTFASILRACACTSALKQAKRVHARIIRAGFESDVFVGTALVDIYSKCSRIDDARQVFDKMSEPNLVSWNAMIVGYVQNGHLDKAIELFCQMPETDAVSWTTMIAGSVQNGFGYAALEFFCHMQEAGIKLDQVTLSSILSACGTLAALEQGKQVHANIIRTGFELDVVVGNSLIDMYAKCGSMQNAQAVFDNMPDQDTISWTAMVAGYAQNGHLKEAVNIFCQIPRPDVVLSNAMISGYGQNGHSYKALELFDQLQNAGMKPNRSTFASVMQACASLAAAEHGKRVHALIIRSGFESDIFVGSAIVDMYGNCQNMEDAKDAFDQMPKQNVVSWTSLIAGYTQNGYSAKALTLFSQMQHEGIKADNFSMTAVLRACSSLASLAQGKQVHATIIRTGYESDISANNALIDMYAQCGLIEDACVVFWKMPELDVTSWNAMIAGFAQHGCGKEALKVFQQMLDVGMKPNEITFVVVLKACSHAGLVDEGHRNFISMSREHGIIPRLEHYSCMVDLLGRAGRFDEAEDFINKMPIEPNAAVWGALLGSCRIHGNSKLAEHVAEHLIELAPEDGGAYTLLSNIYAAAARWDDVGRVRKLMKDRGVKKQPGFSWTEVRNKVHAFVSGDRSHPQEKEIYATLETWAAKIKDAGYVPDIHSVLHDVEEDQKEYLLSHHSEKLAIAFGHISLPPRMTIQVVKNLRVCDDCHTFTKFMSRIAGREIVVRDLNRFHHFKDGQCSCGDYW